MQDAKESAVKLDSLSFDKFSGEIEDMMLHVDQSLKTFKQENDSQIAELTSYFFMLAVIIILLFVSKSCCIYGSCFSCTREKSLRLVPMELRRK